MGILSGHLVFAQIRLPRSCFCYVHYSSLWRPLPRLCGSALSYKFDVGGRIVLLVVVRIACVLSFRMKAGSYVWGRFFLSHVAGVS